jgi:hypothetical protein
MITSLEQQTDLQTGDVRSLLSGVLGTEVMTAEQIAGGKNSRVYKLEIANGQHYSAKFYFRHASDTRDRLRAEFEGLNFLWRNAIRCIPQPIVKDAAVGCAVYEYVEGEEIRDDVSRKDVDIAVSFLASLKNLRNAEGSADLQPASEACFSTKAILAGINGRLERLSAARGDTAEYVELKKFIRHRFMPAFSSVQDWGNRRGKEKSIAQNREIASGERILSPSDFGFHNALRRDDGRIVFLDFEYFGWDDPAKMISDTVLHPGMALADDLKRRFVQNMVSEFDEWHGLRDRIEIVYPLFGLKWCLILLNEFLDDDTDRRRFVGTDHMAPAELRLGQLEKAEKLLSLVDAQYERFPYF